MFKNKKAILLAVIGGPALKISKSSELHVRFGMQCKLKIKVFLKPASNKHEFHKIINELKSNKFRGTSVAQPYKEEAYQLCKNFPNKLTERAKYAGAVNAIKFNEDGSLIGDNTDGIGLVNDIKLNFKFSIKNKKVLIIGAGGVAHGILQPILFEQPKKIVIVNRTPARAKELVKRFKRGKYAEAPIFAFSTNVRFLSEPFDLIINATSSSLHNMLPGELPKEILSKSALCYDVAFHRNGFPLTVFERWADYYNARFANGIGMGIEQGREAFTLWTGKNNPPNGYLVLPYFRYHRKIQQIMQIPFYPLFFIPHKIENKLIKTAQEQQKHANQSIFDKQHALVLYAK